MAPVSATEFEARLRELATDEQRTKYQRFFPGDDSFIGVRMGDVFALAKQNLDMEPSEIERLLGDNDEPALLAFLDQHSPQMARSAVRAATEKLAKPVRNLYVGRKS